MEVYPKTTVGQLPANTRRRYVVDDLDDLKGRTGGVVSLPLWLDWSVWRPRYDLADPQAAGAMYQTVLQEARSEDDLTQFLNRDLLCEVWPSLHLPAYLKDAWEQQHPALREMAPPAGHASTGSGSQYGAAPGRQQG